MSLGKGRVLLKADEGLKHPALISVHGGERKDSTVRSIAREGQARKLDGRQEAT